MHGPMTRDFKRFSLDRIAAAARTLGQFLLSTKSIDDQINRYTNFFTKPVQSRLEFTLRLHWVHRNIAFIANEYLTVLVASSRLMLSSKHSVSKKHTFKAFVS